MEAVEFSRVEIHVKTEAARMETLELTPRSSKKLHVLVVDDNETNRFVAKELLLLEDCNVMSAPNGQDGVELAIRVKFDLILMDISMPKMNGWDAAVCIRSSLEAKSRLTPIFALTAHASSKEKSVMDAAGVQGCIVKPIRGKILKEILTNLNTVEGTIAQNALMMADNMDAPRTSLDYSIINELKELLGQETYAEKCKLFEVELRTGLQQMRKLQKHDSRIEIKQNAHRLSGSAAIFGAVDLRIFLIVLERSILEASSVNIQIMFRHYKKLIAAYNLECKS